MYNKLKQTKANPKKKSEEQILMMEKLRENDKS